MSTTTTDTIDPRNPSPAVRDFVFDRMYPNCSLEQIDAAIEQEFGLRSDDVAALRTHCRELYCADAMRNVLSRLSPNTHGAACAPITFTELSRRVLHDYEAEIRVQTYPSAHWLPSPAEISGRVAGMLLQGYHFTYRLNRALHDAIHAGRMVLRASAPRPGVLRDRALDLYADAVAQGVADAWRAAHCNESPRSAANPAFFGVVIDKHLVEALILHVVPNEQYTAYAIDIDEKG